MAAPGTGAPPGLPQSNIAHHQANRPSGLPNSFQAPPNLPNINFNAPVIRLGTTAPKPQPTGGPSRKDNDTPQSNGPRQGGGNDRNIDQQRQAMRETMQALVPPTRDEVTRTVFVDGITDGIGGTKGLERLLGIAGKLRRLDRATDASGKELTFGFAQFEDIESLYVAFDIFQDIVVPSKKQSPSDESDEKDETYESFEKQPVSFRFDETATKLVETHKEERGEDPEAIARIDASKESLKRLVHQFFYPLTPSSADADGDVMMGDAAAKNSDSVEVVNIPLAQDDELADIPAEMRETVAAEIQAFRDRSIQRDMERLKREEELEAMERQRNGAARTLRQPSPSSSNNIPVGPRGMTNVPYGPKGQKSDLGKDHNRSVEFVNGGTTNGGQLFDREDEDDPASDEELERRRIAKKTAETDKMYADAERRWLNREKSRTAALEREKERDAMDDENFAKNQQKMIEQLKELNEDDESTRKHWEYFQDRSAYIRNRAAFRAREVAADEADRRAEEQELAREESQREQAKGLADSFLEREAQEMEERRPASANVSAPQPFKLSLGAAAQKAQSQRAPRKTMAEVEGLLEDEEEDTTSKRQLIPIKFEPMAAAAMTDEERDQAVRSLAQEIPSETEGLWGWNVQWDFLDESVIREKLRPFIEKKLVEYLGVQEELLIEVVEEHLRKHSKPTELVEELAEVSHFHLVTMMPPYSHLLTLLPTLGARR